MKKRLVLNDLKNNKLLSVSTFIFMALSALLTALTCVLFTGLIGSVDVLMDRAVTPDFLQMHAGETDEAALEKFAAENGNVSQFQTMLFLNLENGNITINGKSMADSTQDNGVVVQSKKFDFLLDTQNNMIDVKDGEIYVPVCYRAEYDAQKGQTMQIGSNVFTIGGFLRDSQMTSMMSSSKRFLVSQNDYDLLKPSGSEEYLIEFMLNEGADVNVFSAEYADAGMPSNGPAITRPLIRIMNALSDGMMILVILLVGIVMVLISILCIRFTLLAKMESDKREIGMLKAVGIPRKDIRRIYFLKYLVLSAVGAVVGLIAAYIAKRPLQTQLQELYGASENGAVSFIAAVIAVALTEGILLLSVSRLLKRTEKMNVIEALTSSGKSAQSSLSQYILISFVIASGVFLMTVPQNLNSTISSESFVTYMGIGDSEIRVDIRQTEDILSQTKRAEELFAADGDIEKIVSLITKSYRITLPDGLSTNLNIEQGDHTAFPVAYNSGRAPTAENEIALSYLCSDEFKVTTGDTMTVSVNGEDRTFTVCGTYSDITNGGKTAKSIYIDDGSPIMWSIFNIKLKDGASADQWLDTWEPRLTAENINAKPINIRDYVKGTYGQTIEQIKKASAAAIAAAAAVILTVVYLFVCLIAAKDRNEISLRKAIGIKGKEIKLIYYKNIAAAALSGIIAGILAGNILGEAAAGGVLASLGAAGFRFVIDGGMIYAVIPAIALVSVFLSAALGLDRINEIKAYECCLGRE